MGWEESVTARLEMGVSSVAGESDLAAHPRAVIAAVAPPAAQDRSRYIVEKLAELGVDELQWISTEFTRGRPPPEHKSGAWAVAALQQSRGAWLMAVRGTRPVAGLGDDDVEWLIADPVADERSPTMVRGTRPIGVIVGPEGGWSDEERARFPHGLRLGSTILRTETAALVGATRCLQLAGRL